MERNSPLVAVALACLLLLAGCAGGANDAGPTGYQAADGGDELDQERATGEPVEEQADVSAGDRKRVYTAELTVRVAEFDTSRANLTGMVESHGGYIGNSQISTTERDNETYRDGQFTYRVPTENYTEFVEAVTTEGVVLYETENVDDVTEKHADLTARLENLREERDRLRELYEQANDTEEVLLVEERLSDVQGEIERTEARLETLENRIAYATVTVELREERPDTEPDRDRWYDTGVVSAFLDSVDGALVALRALVVGIAYALPYLIAFGVPMAVLTVGFSRLFVGGLPSLRDGDDDAATDDEEPPAETVELPEDAEQ